MNIATVKAKPDLQQITVTIYVPKLMVLRLRLGVWLAWLAVRVSGYKLKISVDDGKPA